MGDPGKGCGYVLLMALAVLIVGIISPTLGATLFFIFAGYLVIRFIIELFRG